MRILLDTHAAIWFLDDPGRIADEALAELERPGTVGYLSAASVWETAIKQARGRITLPEPLEVGATRVGLRELPVTWAHGCTAAALPPVHQDPFDRMLVAQAVDEGLVLLTRDPVLAQYPISTMRA